MSPLTEQGLTLWEHRRRRTTMKWAAGITLAGAVLLAPADETHKLLEEASSSLSKGWEQASAMIGNYMPSFTSETMATENVDMSVVLPPAANKCASLSGLLTSPVSAYDKSFFDLGASFGESTLCQGPVSMMGGVAAFNRFDTAVVHFASFTPIR